ncbi:DUF5709 domain-containing protein [Streptomyces zagrosensis]|uniref:DUF5709 domain-containing protein n=1 Tax=Streptomyces zagrosensis TaxID=1042984 RepID=A0A7W9QCS4_9ACTN|nr:DUF5709 domain-containing protein [Streptomyces zagrosensis]MBB5937731.1 hypothetical protein [Streptomyces zagrosensis]
MTTPDNREPRDDGRYPHDLHDPGADPEDEGIPDLQDGTPEQQRASDPQQMPVPGDQPTIAEYRSTTTNEAWERESLDERLADEVPDVGANEPSGAGPVDAPWADTAQEEVAGLLYDEPDPDQPREQDVYSQEGSTSGLSAEEQAVHVVADEDENSGVGGAGISDV